MRFKIQADKMTEALCGSCDHALIYRQRDGKVTTRCTHYGENYLIPGDIVECNGFHDKHEVNRYELEKIAWTLNSDKKGQFIGFARPKPPKDE